MCQGLSKTSRMWLGTEIILKKHNVRAHYVHVLTAFKVAIKQRLSSDVVPAKHFAIFRDNRLQQPMVQNQRNALSARTCYDVQTTNSL